MIYSIEALLKTWQYDHRYVILSLINGLSDDELDREFPGKGPGTARLLFVEMAGIQKNYIDALSTKTVQFEKVPLEDSSKDGIIKRLSALEKELEKALEGLDGTETVDFCGEDENVHALIAGLIGHVNMYVGQLVAFCHATGIDIPEDAIESLGLDG
ncbi:MAG: hypothetical protein FWE26_02645 [Coriobacteriia bacterium]|nr:hypothetical protein [Coriobacteriia bacterium]MCL2870515.1 hypothetical protein [Coriobacteriia bacterium]